LLQNFIALKNLLHLLGPVASTSTTTPLRPLESDDSRGVEKVVVAAAAIIIIIVISYFHISVITTLGKKKCCSTYFSKYCGRVVNTFLFGRSQFQISAWQPAILIDVFHGFPVPPGECWDSTLKLSHDHFLSHPFQLIIHVSPFYVMLYILSY
jgi:hypothetical protein